MDSNYIRVFDNCLSEEFCDRAIKAFHNQPKEHTVQDKGSYSFHTKLTQLDITKQYMDGNKECEYIHNHLIDVGRLIVDDYLDNLPSPVHPKAIDNWEPFRLKRYLPDGEEGFGLHGDCNSIGSSARWLAFFWYLNDVEEGGRTIFSYDGENEIGAIEAKRGRCLVFPPTWTYPHIGEKPISNEKYIIGSYLHHYTTDELLDSHENSIKKWLKKR